MADITAHLKHQAIGGLVRGSVDVLGGRDPKQALNSHVRGVVAGVMGAALCNTIGHAYGQNDINGVSHKLLHGIVGGIEGAILDGKDGIAVGALGAIVSESLVEVIVPNLTELSMEAYLEGDTPQAQKQILEDKLKAYTDRATLITAATLCGLGVDRVDIAIETAQPAVENNFVLQAIGLGLTVFEVIEAYQEGGLNQALITGVTGAALSIIGAKGISALTKTPRMVELLGKISAKASKARGTKPVTGVKPTTTTPAPKPAKDMTQGDLTKITSKPPVTKEGIQLEIKYKDGMNKKDFDRKVTGLQKGVQDGKFESIVPTKISDAERRKITRDYRKTVIEKVNGIYKDNPEAKSNALSRLKQSDIDHTIDLQLGGQNNMSNLRALDKIVNRSVGTQVQKQMSNGQSTTISNVIPK